MAKTMAELYKELGPQGWVDDPPDKSDPNAEIIQELEKLLKDIDAELEDIEGEVLELHDREQSLLEQAQIAEKRLKALRA